jgi:hypothetical protein
MKNVKTYAPQYELTFGNQLALRSFFVAGDAGCTAGGHLSAEEAQIQYE